jgi:hypothetical protein
MAICDNSYNSLIKIFDAGGVKPFDREFSKDIVMFNPVEQFLFKVVKDYLKVWTIIMMFIDFNLT